MEDFDEVRKNDPPSIRQRLTAQEREKRDAYDQSLDGQEDNAQKYRRWAFDQYEACRDGVVTNAQWVDETGRRRVATFPGVGLGGGSIPANAIIRSNHRSRKQRLDKLREMIAVCEVMLAQLKAKKLLSANYLEALDDLLGAIPDENVLEEVGPKAKK